MGGLVGIVAGDLAVIEPERNIHTLNFVYGMLCKEGTGQEGLSLVVSFQFVDGILLLQLEGDHKVRPQSPGELPGNNGGIAAIGTGCCGGGFLAEQLGTAGRAVVSLEGSSLSAPVIAEAGSIPLALQSGSFHGRSGLFVLFLILRFDFCHFEAAAAVFTFQLSGGCGKLQRTGTGRTLVVADLCCHALCLR